MKKTIFTIVFALIFCVISATPVFAASGLLIIDDADLISDSDENAIATSLNNIRTTYNFDAVIVTVETTGDKTPMEFADDYFDYNGYGSGPNHDGVLLLIVMDTRDRWISTRGYGITVFTDAGIEYIENKIVPDLSGEFYADAFMVFAEQCRLFIEQANTGDPFDTHNLPTEPFDPGFSLLLSLFIGSIISFITVGIMKGKLITVHSQYTASNYVKKESLNITESRDFFIYRNVSRTEKASSSDSGGSITHKSSSSATHGGGGGKF